jgi:hypothetical protein
MLGLQMKYRILVLMALIFACLTTVGCGNNPRIEGTVKSLRDVNKAESGKKCYLYCSVKDKSNLDLEFKEIKRLVTVLLNESGYSIVSSLDDSDLVIPIYYSISDRHTETWERPIYNMSGGTTTFQSNTYTGSGYGTTTYGSINQPYQMNYAGSVTETSSYFIRYINISAANKREALVTKGEFPLIWEINAVSPGASGNLLEIMPYLLYAMRGHVGKMNIKGTRFELPRSNKKIDEYFGYITK